MIFIKVNDLNSIDKPDNMQPNTYFFNFRHFEKSGLKRNIISIKMNIITKIFSK